MDIEIKSEGVERQREREREREMKIEIKRDREGKEETPEDTDLITLPTIR